MEYGRSYHHVGQPGESRQWINPYSQRPMPPTNYQEQRQFHQMRMYPMARGPNNFQNPNFNSYPPQPIPHFHHFPYFSPMHPMVCAELPEPKQTTKVYRDQLLKDYKHNISHLNDIFGTRAVREMTEDGRKEKMDAMNYDRSLINAWAKQTLRKRMLKKAREVRMRVKGRLVQRFSDIGKSWKGDGSVNNARLLYHVCFSDYEMSNRGWSRAMEQTYMEENSLEYLPEKDTTKSGKTKRGCYERIITHAKGKLVKALNSKSEKTHTKLMCITLTKLDKMENRKPSWWKRGPGAFFVRTVESVSTKGRTDDYRQNMF
jgi:hypothetical protein